MKLVFSRHEVAEALGLPEDAFVKILPALFVEQFPQPIPGLGERWSIIDVMQWVNRDKPRSGTVGATAMERTVRH
jgi:hypothetical protein